MIRLPPRSTRTDTLFPYTTLFRSVPGQTLQLHRQVEQAAHLGVVLILGGQLGDAVQCPLQGPRIGRMVGNELRSEEHTSELQSLMRNSYAVFCLKKKTTNLSMRLHNYRQNDTYQTKDNTATK